MKKPRFKVLPEGEMDKNRAKRMEEILNHQWDKQGNWITSLSLIPLKIEARYGLSIPPDEWLEIIKPLIKDIYESQDKPQ